MECWQEINRDFTGTTEVKRKFSNGKQRHAKGGGGRSSSQIDSQTKIVRQKENLRVSACL